jgi:hypothetical protein
MRRGGNSTGGSNPSLSAIDFSKYLILQAYLSYLRHGVASATLQATYRAALSRTGKRAHR